MSGYDYSRPFIQFEDLNWYVAKDKRTASLYGSEVKAVVLSNIEYKTRYGKRCESQRMKPPPSCGRIFPGFLVVRKIGSPDQYETWMPDHVFDELYDPR